ncbi:MAG: IPT/TIG domain-containing protein, partial [Dehalococcoidia bacterium]
ASTIPPGMEIGGPGFRYYTREGVPVFVGPIVICYPACPPGSSTASGGSSSRLANPNAYYVCGPQCANQTGVTADVTFDDGTPPMLGIPMTESPAGSGYYQSAKINVPAHHGTPKVTIHPPPGSPEPDKPGYLYEDPSGVVQTSTGQKVIGATVTLLQSSSPSGPFTPVPDGSPMMAPSNRRNPDVTDNDGTFHWDVLAGYYEVQASKAGCNDANGNPIIAFTTPKILPVPPPQTGLVITLDCPSNTPGPSVSATAPFTGPSRGGTVITISGSNFQSGATVVFGDKPGAAVSVSADGRTITVTTPALPLIGDVNNDGNVNAVDALCVLRDVAVLPQTPACPTVALNTRVGIVVTNPSGQSAMSSGGHVYNTEDVNGDGQVNAVDALCILRSVAMLSATTVCPVIFIPAISNGRMGVAGTGEDSGSNSESAPHPSLVPTHLGEDPGAGLG